jgi:hypothetical protein
VSAKNPHKNGYIWKAKKTQENPAFFAEKVYE